MDLDPKTLASLRALLSPIDSIDRDVKALAVPIDAARSAAARLQTELAAIDQKIAATAISPLAPIPADPNRLEALIAGADVPKIDPKEVEAHAAKATAIASKARVLGAERQQLAADLAAVQGRMHDLEHRVAHLGLERVPLELAFMVALGEALSDAYRRAIIKFVETHIPPLLSVATEVTKATGREPHYVSNVMFGLAVNWPDEAYTLPTIGGAMRMSQVWPRNDRTLISGEPASSPQIVEQVISAVRASGEASAQGAVEAAA
jgi:outer membrane murein-binding lipoprotein Lpp